jgi:hypothetical protein
VQIYDKDGNLVANLNTDGNGRITPQELNYKRYYYSGGFLSQDYYPYRLVITKAGYETYEDQLDMDRKMDLEIGLSVVSPLGYVNVPSGEVDVTLTAPALLEVALEAAAITVELSDG